MVADFFNLVFFFGKFRVAAIGLEETPVTTDDMSHTEFLRQDNSCLTTLIHLLESARASSVKRRTSFFFIQCL